MNLNANQKIALLVIIATFIAIGIMVNDKSEPTSPTTQNTPSYQPPIEPTIALQQGMKYEYHPSYPCEPSNDKVCLTPEEYKELCMQASGITVMGAKLLASFDHVARALLEGGEIERIGVKWNSDLSQCMAFVTVSGIYQGTSMRKSLFGDVYEFIYNDQNKILASGTTN